MEYLTCQEASLKWNISLRRIQQMCKSGEIKGVKKERRNWLIPSNAIIENKIQIKKKPLPIGISDFKKATTEYYYVDKTLLIRDFLDTRPNVTLFTRPRRFGKTLTMDMLRVFFEKTNKDTSKYFRDKKIWKCGEYYTSFQGKFPCIFLTFKDIKCATWEDTYDKIKKIISIEFLRHNELENSDKLNSFEKEQYAKFSSMNIDEVDCQMSLQILSRLLYRHYGIECVIIIDEYDTPIQEGYSCGFYNKIIEFMRNFFSGGLKDNIYLGYGFLTGILRVAKENIFSGLNNLKIYSVLDNQYSQYFGFTKDEIKEMLEYYDIENKYEEIVSWYDGYLFGNTEIFNPWSVINYISDDCFPKAFWLSTGSNDIIGEIVSNASSEIVENLQKLLMGESITTYIDTNVIYPEIHDNIYSIYSFLLVTGYLKVVSIYPQNDGNYMCEVALPNKEISFVYEKEVLSKINKGNIAISFQQALFKNNINELENILKNYMIESISSFDTSNESFYHGMMLGLCAIVSSKYKVLSNRESGLGRFDIELVPSNKNNPGFIFEFKYTKNNKELDKLSNDALKQIDEKQYDFLMKQVGINKIIKVGISFCGKESKVMSVSELYLI